MRAICMRYEDVNQKRGNGKEIRREIVRGFAQLGVCILALVAAAAIRFLVWMPGY